MAGLNIIVDDDQLPEFSGTLSQARWPVIDLSDGKVKTVKASQIAGTGSLDVVKITAPGGDTIPIPALEGKEVKDICRFGAGSCGLILTNEEDEPTGSNVKWFDEILTYPEGNGPLSGEILTIYFK